MSTAAVAGSAAFLAACGGSDSDGGDAGGSKDRSGLLHQIVDETKEAKRGGTLVGSHPGVILTFDPMKTGVNIRGARRGYSQLFRIKDGILQNTDGGVEGDFAMSWEISPDKLTLTAKIDPGVGTPNVAPVNGRVMDAEDVVFSWERLKKSGALRADYAHELNPGAPIVSITAPDKQTVVIKLAEPDATILGALATDRIGTMFIMPREFEKTDADREAVGSGPFYITDKSEVSYRWKRNPNFKRTNLKDNEPYFDEIFEPVLVDVSTNTAQFRTGAIYWYTGIPAGEIVQVKRDNANLIMRATDPVITGTERIYFGQNSDSPFKDERVRIAYFKTMDRDAFIAAALNTDQFAKEGLELETFWEAGLGSGSYRSAYIDPRSKEFGPNAKNYVYDIAEAKKLLEAAGLKTPVEFNQVYAAPGPSGIPATFYTRAEIFMGMVESSGIFNPKRVLLNYQTEWNTDKYRFSSGKFSGATWGPDTASPDGATAAFFLYNSKGGYFQGGDATMDDLTTKARREFDDAKRSELVKEIQRYNGGKFWQNKLGHAGRYELNWPAYRNVGVRRGGTNWLDSREFLDPTKAPLNKA